VAGSVPLKKYWVLLELREPNRVTATTRIFNHVRDDIKAVPGKKGAIFRAIQARVIQWLALNSAHRDAMIGPAREHQCGFRSRIRSKHRKHPALIVVTEMEKLSQAMRPLKT
jgi:hypothetical protein